MRTKINQFFSRKPWKYSLIALCIGAWFLAGNKACNLYRVSHPKIEQSQNLIVNPSPYKRFVTKKSELEGIADLQRHAQIPGDEEAWMYVPQDKNKVITPSRVGYWKETGGTQTEHDVKTLRVEIKRLMRENKFIIDYHIHRPDSAESIEDLEKRLATKIEEIESNYSDKAKVEKLKTMVTRTYHQSKYASAISEALPSAIDLRGMIELSEQFYKIHPDGEIRFKIASEYGIAEYNLARPLSESRERTRQLEKAGKLNQHLEIRAAQAESVVDISLQNPLMRQQIIAGIRKICEAMSDKIIKVTFTPYEYYSSLKNNQAPREQK